MHDSSLSLKIQSYDMWDAQRHFIRAGAAGLTESARYLDYASIWKALECRDTLLVRGSWLMQWSASGKTLTRRQDMPDEAYWDAEELRKQFEAHGNVLISALSYCWGSKEHPDPDGRQLGVLSKAIERCLSVHFGDNSKMWVDLAVFIDFCSLHQSPRSDEDTLSFKRGLCDVNLWYAHQATDSWLLTMPLPDSLPYDERGWPTFERAVSSMLTPCYALVDLETFAQDGGRKNQQKNQPARNPPFIATLFAELLNDKTFTNGSDREMVAEIYTKTFQELMSGVQRLMYDNLSWGMRQVSQLAEALPHCQRLRELRLHGNAIDADAVAPLASALPKCCCLRTLGLGTNPLGNEGISALAACLPMCEQLVVLSVEETDCGDEGAKALAAVLPKVVRLGLLFIQVNEIGDEGALALVAALRLHSPALGLVNIRKNLFGGSAKEALRQWCEENGCIMKANPKNDTGRSRSRKGTGGHHM